MNEFELALPDKDGFEKYLDELQPAKPVLWFNNLHCYKPVTTEEVISKYSIGFDRFKSSLRYVYEYGSAVVSGIPKLCLALMDIFDGMHYVACPDYLIPEKELGSDLAPGTCYDLYSEYLKKGDTFAKIVSQFGLSDTAAYNYRNLGVLVDRNTGDFLPRYQGYSVSLLIEMQAYLKSMNYAISSYDFERLTDVVPKSTSVRDFRNYRKIMSLWKSYKTPFKFSSDHNAIKMYSTSLPDVLSIYDKLIQEQEENKLNALTAQAESKDKPKAEELVGNDVLIKQLREQITELKKTTVPNLGKCDGCVYSGVNLNKCRCCRRYKDLKDLFKSE